MGSEGSGSRAVWWVAAAAVTVVAALVLVVVYAGPGAPEAGGRATTAWDGLYRLEAAETGCDELVPAAVTDPPFDTARYFVVRTVRWSEAEPVVVGYPHPTEAEARAQWERGVVVHEQRMPASLHLGDGGAASLVESLRPLLVQGWWIPEQEDGALAAVDEAELSAPGGCVRARVRTLIDRLDGTDVLAVRRSIASTGVLPECESVPREAGCVASAALRLRPIE